MFSGFDTGTRRVALAQAVLVPVAALVGWVFAGIGAGLAALYGVLVALSVSAVLVWRERQSILHPEWDQHRLFKLFVRAAIERLVLLVGLVASGLPRRPALFQMSRSSPGRYAVHEFAKNVYAVRAEDGAGNPLTVTRADPYSWSVAGHTGTVRFSYILYADRADGTYAQVDGTHAHLNMPASFIWIRGLESLPMSVSFRLPADSKWKAATQLFPTDDPLRFTAPNLQYFMDSPVELSDHAVREWRVMSPAGSFPVRVAMHHQGSEAELDAYVEKLTRVVEQQVAVFAADAAADVSATALISNLYGVNVETGEVRRLTDFEGARVQEVSWMPGSDVIACTAVLNDRMTVFLQNTASGEAKSDPAGWELLCEFAPKVVIDEIALGHCRGVDHPVRAERELHTAIRRARRNQFGQDLHAGGVDPLDSRTHPDIHRVPPACRAGPHAASHRHGIPYA